MKAAAHPTIRPRRWAWALALACVAGSLSAAPPEPAASGSGAAVDPDWILARLAQPASMRTAFVEIRGSALLKAPLRLSGEYQRLEYDTLVREVRAPYAETTTIRAGEVKIQRAGKAARTFSLARAPELAGLQASFGALLAGDRKRLEQQYLVAAEGTRQQWTMTLTPRSSAVAAKLQGITLRGRGAELRCIEARPARSDASGGIELQRTLLAGAAREAANVTDASQFAALCRGHGAAQR
ncbi:LolA-related protein [Lysobacter sp. Root604]|uniref:LolA-related protein n=1 Tax=Lysobacter sp. Root604 TaxID=1736568 RepID=UPI0026F42FD8|nr:LolA-related protein [Lysobacter sp. Root604]